MTAICRPTVVVNLSSKRTNIGYLYANPGVLFQSNLAEHSTEGVFRPPDLQGERETSNQFFQKYCAATITYRLRMRLGRFMEGKTPERVFYGACFSQSWIVRLAFDCEISHCPDLDYQLELAGTMGNYAVGSIIHDSFAVPFCASVVFSQRSSITINTSDRHRSSSYHLSTS
jgi:hypothetical protein